MSQFVSDRSYDYFDLGDESDQEGAESSEDEIDIILHGTPEQRRRLCHSHARERSQRAGQQSGHSMASQRTDRQSSSEDEFEKEMNAELDKTVSLLEKSRGSKAGPEPPAKPSTAPEPDTAMQTNSSSGSAGKSNPPFYSDIYFDSDDEENYEGEGDARVQRHHMKPSNDDLLYDPDMDDEDQRWVDRQRQQQHGHRKQGAGTRGRAEKKRAAAKSDAVPRSDAVLDCPACMTTLCLDCQRHDIYPNQYRAMFVMNCKVNHSEVLSVPEQAVTKKSKKPKKSKGGVGKVEDAGSHGDETSSSSSKDQFHPVMCAECDTVVGVVDVEEVYHFFNVIPCQP